MKNTNTRNIILVILGIAVIGAGTLYFSSNDAEELKEKTSDVKMEKVLPEFGDLTNFVKKDLGVEEKENLKIILEQRKDRQLQIKEILDEAYKNGDMENAWIEVAAMREKCKGRITPYISEEAKNDFDNYCASLGEKLESNYVQK